MRSNRDEGGGTLAVEETDESRIAVGGGQSRIAESWTGGRSVTRGKRERVTVEALG